jgi:hypothetical protein
MIPLICGSEKPLPIVVDAQIDTMSARGNGRRVWALREARSMARVMPSQVVQAIDGLFPHASKLQSNALLTIGSGPQLRAILKLLSDVPEELIVLPLADYADHIGQKHDR